jgi:hypothetical protein
MSELRMTLPAEVLDAIQKCADAYGLGLQTEEDWINPEPNSMIALAAFCYQLGVKHGREDAE